MRLALLLLAVVGCSGGKTLLRFHPRSGTYRYTMQQSLKGGLSGGPAGAAVMPVGEAVITGEFREGVEGPRDGGICVTWRIDTGSVTSATRAGRVPGGAPHGNKIARGPAVTVQGGYRGRTSPT